MAAAQSSHGRASGRLCLMVEEDPSITLNAPKERLLNDFEVRVSVSPIHNYLEGRLFTVKKVHYQMVEANNPLNKALRLEYVQRMSTHMLQDKTIIWMNETNINLYWSAHPRKSSSWPANCGRFTWVKRFKCSRDLRHHYFQVVKWSRLRGAFRSQSAKDWLADMLQHLPQGSTHK